MSIGPGASATARLAALQGRLINHVAAAVSGGTCVAAAAVPRLQTGDGQLHRMLNFQQQQQQGEDASGLYLLRPAAGAAEAAWAAERVWSGDARSCGAWAAAGGVQLAVGAEPADVFFSGDGGGAWTGGTDSFAGIESRPGWTFPPPPHQPHVLSLERLASGQVRAAAWWVSKAARLCCSTTQSACRELNEARLPAAQPPTPLRSWWLASRWAACWSAPTQPAARGRSAAGGCTWMCTGALHVVALPQRRARNPLHTDVCACFSAESKRTLQHPPRSCRVDPHDASHWLAVTGMHCCRCRRCRRRRCCCWCLPGAWCVPGCRTGSAGAGVLARARAGPEPRSPRRAEPQGGACTRRATAAPAGSTAAPTPSPASTPWGWPSTPTARWAASAWACPCLAWPGLTVWGRAAQQALRACCRTAPCQHPLLRPGPPSPRFRAPHPPPGRGAADRGGPPAQRGRARVPLHLGWRQLAGGQPAPA